MDVVYKTLLQHKLISPMDNPHPYDPQPRPPWWNETSFCEYHQNKGHKTSNYINLRHKVQDMIDVGELVVDGHNKNSDHKVFKEPFPAYEKGETSKPEPYNKVNYMYSNDENVIHMVEPIDFEYCDIITIKGKQDNDKPKTPFVLRGPTSNNMDNASSQHCANTITHSDAKLVLKGPTPPTSNLEQHKDKALAGPSGKGAKHMTKLTVTSYSVLDQLK